MKLLERFHDVAASPTTGRAMNVVKVLNLIGTVRGAVTTVLLAAGLVGGAATVNTVREDVERARPTPDATAARTRVPATPSPTPLTAAALRADLQNRLQATLAVDAAAVDDVRKVAILSGAPLDQLIADSKQRLQTRYDQGIVQLGALLGPTPGSNPSSPGPSPSVSVVTANALFQVIKGDLDQIVVQATRAATSPTPIPRTAPPTAPPTQAPTATPVRTAAPTPTHATARPTPSPTR